MSGASSRFPDFFLPCILHITRTRHGPIDCPTEDVGLMHDNEAANHHHDDDVTYHSLLPAISAADSLLSPWPDKSLLY